MRHSIRMIGAAAVLAFALTACDETIAPEDGPDGVAPTIPPATSFVIDFDDFVSPALAATPEVQLSPAAGTYWTRSAFVVAAWNAIITVTLAPPTAAFVASLSQQPEWNGDLNAWTWTFNFNVLAVQHSARLEARLTTNGVQWDMYITRDGSFTDFHWYTGTSHVSGTSGEWTLNRSPEDPTPLIDIDWNRSLSGDTYDITYTNVVAGSTENGSYITHGVTGDTPFDAYYDLYGSQGGNLTEIEWNRVTKDGRTRDPAHFGDSDWRCWDEDLENATCQ